MARHERQVLGPFIRALLMALLTLPAIISGCAGKGTTAANTSSTLSTSITISSTPAARVTLTVAAASSLTDALKEIDAVYSAANPSVTIVSNFASSGTLQIQIQNGAPVDVFVSAAIAQMDNLQKDQLVLTETRRNLLNNNVVLIVPVGSSLNLSSFTDLTFDKVKKIAIGDPKSVPAGTYASQAFDQLGIASQLQPKLVLGADVRQVLTYVETGNVDAGVVYSTDALTSGQVKVVALAPADINARVVYPVAVIQSSNNQDAAKAYEEYLFGQQARFVFEKYGFAMAPN
jgi:molybdate transport system substrate-binding protein